MTQPQSELYPDQMPSKSSSCNVNGDSFKQYGRKNREKLSRSALSAAVHSKLLHFIGLLILSILLIVERPQAVPFFVFYPSVASPLVYMAVFWQHVIFDFFVTEHLVENSLGTFQWFTAVDDNLLLGAIPICDLHEEALLKLNLALVVSVVQPFELQATSLLGDPIRPEFWKKNGIDHVVFTTQDFYPPSLEVIDQGAKLLDRYLSEGRRVYIHCKSGVGRSASIVLAYFYKYRYTGLDLRAAYQKLKLRRKVVFGPHSPQYKQLQKYAQKARAASQGNLSSM